MHTLTIRGTSLTGAPDTGDLVQLINVDNTALLDPEAGAGVFHDGMMKFSVLAGRPATLRFTLDVSRTSKFFPLSTATETAWTWHTAPAGPATLPARWTCARRSPGPGTARCSR